MIENLKNFLEMGGGARSNQSLVNNFNKSHPIMETLSAKTGALDPLTSDKIQAEFL